MYLIEQCEMIGMIGMIEMIGMRVMREIALGHIQSQGLAREYTCHLNFKSKKSLCWVIAPEFHLLQHPKLMKRDPCQFLRRDFLLHHPDLQEKEHLFQHPKHHMVHPLLPCTGLQEKGLLLRYLQLQKKIPILSHPWNRQRSPDLPGKIHTLQDRRPRRQRMFLRNSRRPR